MFEDLDKPQLFLEKILFQPKAYFRDDGFCYILSEARANSEIDPYPTIEMSVGSKPAIF